MKKGVMKVSEYKDFVYYRIACGCLSDRHDASLIFENDDGLVSITLSQTLRSKNINRFKLLFKLLFTGKVELEGDFILTENNVDGFIEALEEGKKMYTGKEIK